MSEHDFRRACLVWSVAVLACTVLTIDSVVVAAEIGLLPRTTSGDVAAPLGVVARNADRPRSAGFSPATTAEPPAVRGMAPSDTAGVAIPALGIESATVPLSLDANTGALQVPTDYAVAGWYADGPYPGQADGPPAVIVGHVDSLTGPAVFYRLREIQPDTEIRVARDDGSTAVFRVVDARQYPKDALPAGEVYARRQPAELVLITCTGEFDEQTRSYLDNFVVTARLDAAASGVAT